MQSISEWLQSLDLDQYTQVFADNDIDFGLIGRLSEQDLKELGVSSMGHRKKLLAAIEELDDATIAAASSLPTTQRLPSDSSERRQLTVMFCDLVGSTALSQKLDPETLRELMRSYQQSCGAVIDQYDGHVAQYLGDGLMTYFGWPRAHEDDAERAVRASLNILEAIKAIEPPLQVRIGIATGPVVVGETGAGDASVPKMAVGETPNLAARLQALATPDTVVIAPTTRHLISGTFEIADLGLKALDGIENEIRAFRVVGELAVESRFDAQNTGRLTGFIGRDSETAILLDRWDQAREAEGQVVLLSGEPGIGKSRLVQEFREKISDQPKTNMRYQCSPHHNNSSFYPIIQQLERVAKFARGDTTDVKLDKLEGVLAQTAHENGDVTPLIASMMALPADRYAPIDLSVQRLKERTIEALAERIVALSVSTPVLITFEDVHWADPTTLDVITMVVNRIQSHPVLLVVTHRPEFESPWSGHGHVTAHSLNRLSRRRGHEMVLMVTGGKPLPATVVDEIVARTDGIPLFVEELTKTILEANFLRDSGDAYVLDGPLPKMAIPNTLQDSLTSRIDHLAEAKDVAQIGACIGREFSYEMVAAVSSMTGKQLHTSLEQLMNSELISVRGTPPDSQYIFKHALIQEAAYQRLLKSKRQQFHQAIATELEDRQRQGQAIAPETLAHHFSGAGIANKAAAYWLEAGRAAMRRSASLEAINFLVEGRGLHEFISSGPDRQQVEFDTLITLGAAYQTAYGWGAKQASQSIAKAMQFVEPFKDLETEAKAENLIGLNLIWQGQIAEAYQRSRKMIAKLETSRGTGAWFGFASAIMTADIFYGNFLEAIDISERYIHDSNAGLVRDWTSEIGMDINALAYLSAATAHWFAGNQDLALKRARQSMETAEEGGHWPSRAIMCIFGGDVFYHARQYAESLRNAEIGRDIAKKHNLEMLRVVAGMFEGRARAALGDLEDGIAQMRGNLDLYRNMGGVTIGQRMEADLAEALGRAERVDEGLEMIQSRPQEQRVQNPQIYIIEGDLLRRQKRDHQADSCYRHAIAISQKDQTLSLELRSTLQLARLLRDQNRIDEAYSVLSPVFNRVSEGFELPDLVEAKALLDEMR
jgi:class 3 adenylate cyclase